MKAIRPFKSVVVGLCLLCHFVASDLNQQLADKIVSSISEFIEDLNIDSVDIDADITMEAFNAEFTAGRLDVNGSLNSDETMLYINCTAAEEDININITTPETIQLFSDLNTPELHMNVTTITPPKITADMDYKGLANLAGTMGGGEWEFNVDMGEVETAPMDVVVKTPRVGMTGTLDTKQMHFNATMATSDMDLSMTIAQLEFPTFHIGHVEFGPEFRHWAGLLAFQVAMIVYFLFDHWRFHRLLEPGFDMHAREFSEGTKCSACGLMGNMVTARYCAECGAKITSGSREGESRRDVKL